ncbi:hypothetical protein JAAARDRAFT_206269 [Jaapia argillacea MUCL 33604]|uniref:Peptidase C14 caspase domain-containing protein n=1 Tax=Jaapia argillacea MUCL 33604 TaxID=933084 RepID=A0A067PWT6_9AGAM|nr:hypothetical protein JAAARDRAFT_206269 [Jaapia argillacea MUCL 33604]
MTSSVSNCSQMAEYPSSSIRSFHALLVGVNEYADLETSPLRGAVQDALDMKSFITGVLKVPQSNVITLLDEDATREHIIETFRSHLVNNPHIIPGSPILFYFSGHGSKSDDGARESICPHDRDPDNGVDDIKDYELGDLLRELAEAKGDNITVIMDCCHSGSGTRNVTSETEDSYCAIRSAPPLPTRPRPHPPSSILQETFDFGTIRSGRVKGGFQDPGLHTHVLLAACHPDERAMEITVKGEKGIKRPGGYFTSNLLKTLKATPLPKTSYSNLLAKVKVLSQMVADRENEGQQKLCRQTPQCEGNNKGRLMFDGKAIGVDKRLVPVAVQDGMMQVDAGEIHGVSLGTEFSIYPDNSFHSPSTLLGTAIAQYINAVSSVATLVQNPLEIPNNCYALVAVLNNTPFKVAFDNPDGQSGRLTSLKKHLMEGRKVDEAYGESEIAHYTGNIAVTCTDDSSDPDVKLVVYIESVDGHEDLCLKRSDTLMTADMPPLVHPQGLFSSDVDFINLAARFEFYLHHTNPLHPYRNQVTVELLPRPSRFQPFRENVLTEDGCANLKHGGDDYALSIQNSSNHDLWVLIYYFDPGKFHITEMYSPPSRKGDVTVKKGKIFCIGDRYSGSAPFEFYLEDHQTVDNGFLKIYFSDRFADLAMIEQVDYEYQEPDTFHRGSGGGIEGGDWDELTIPIHVYRG